MRHWCVCGTGFRRERELDEHIFRQALAACALDWRTKTPAHGPDVKIPQESRR